MSAFRVKVFKDGKLVHDGLAIAKSSAELFNSAIDRYFPCFVNVIYLKSKGAQS